ncbi:hypothetical protein [Rhodopseudomonas sp. P1]
MRKTGRDGSGFALHHESAARLMVTIKLNVLPPQQAALVAVSAAA